MKIKKIFLIFFIFISLFSFLKTTLAQTDNTKGVYNYNYVSSFDGSQQSPVTIKEDKDATGLGSTLNYILTFLAVAIIVFIIFRLLQGAFLKGTYDNIYDQTSGNKSIKVAGTALVVFILAYAVLSFINPQLTGWSVATNFVSNLTAGGSGGGGGADSSYSNNMCRVDPTYNAKSIKEQLKDDEQFAACPYYDVDAYSIGYGYHLNSGNNKKEMENAGIDDDTINNILNYKGNKGCPAGAPRITEAQADKLLDIKLDLAKKSAAT